MSEKDSIAAPGELLMMGVEVWPAQMGREGRFGGEHCATGLWGLRRKRKRERGEKGKGGKKRAKEEGSI